MAENGGRDGSSPRISSATANSYADPESQQPLCGSSIPIPTPQLAKTRKNTQERSEPRQ